MEHIQFTFQCPDTGMVVKVEVEWDEDTGKVDTFTAMCIDEEDRYDEDLDAENLIKDTEQWCQDITGLGTPFGVGSLVNRLKHYGVDRFDIPMELLEWES